MDDTIKRGCQPPGGGRLTYFDMARGAAILLVILLHWQAFFSTFYGDIKLLKEALEIINEAAAPIRMEMLFFISGFFVKIKIGFFRKKITHILYPYIVWTLLMVLTSAVLYGASGSLIRIEKIIYGTAPLTWYLYYLFLFYILVYFFSGRNPLYVLIAVFVIYLFGDDLYKEVVRPELRAGWFTYRYIADYFLYFYCGYLLRKFRSNLGVFLGNNIVVSASGIVFFMLLAQIHDLQRLGVHSGSLVYFPWVVISFIYILAVFYRISENNVVAKFLLMLGRNSVYYFLLHWSIFEIASRMYGRAEAGLASFIYALVCLLGGVCIPYAASKIRIVRLLFMIGR